MDMTILAWIVGQLVAGAAIYGGIRVDLKSIHTRLGLSEASAAEAHRRHDAGITAANRRIDDILASRKERI